MPRDLNIGEDEFAARSARWRKPIPIHDSGRLGIYRRNVGPLSEGAVQVRGGARREG